MREMVLRQLSQRFVRLLRSIKKKHYIIGSVGLLVVFYAISFFIPQPVAFSYAGTTCAKRVTMLPGIHVSDDSTYSISFTDIAKIGNVPIVSFKTCFTAKRNPIEGKRIASVAPFGGPLLRSQFNVTTDASPKLNIHAVPAEIPVSKALIFPMNKTDKVHTYALRIGDKTVPCKAGNKNLSCDVPSLDLAQGQTYSYTVERRFKQGSRSQIEAAQFKTLKAVTVVDSSIKPGQTMYARPTELQITTDKPIAKSKVSIISDGKPVDASSGAKGNIITVKLAAELPREKSFELKVESAEATDGSNLVEPYVIPFKTSGGPVVSNVSVGTSGVGQSAAIILTFDQTLSKTKDIAGFVSFSGGNAGIQKVNDTQIRVQLSALPLCQPFTLVVKQGLLSEYDIPSAKEWSFTSRTTCYQAVGYGTSLKGRALTAYVFGSSGPVTMYVGGIHGNEPSSTTLMRAWIAELEANPARTAGKRIVIVPAINPDGLVANTRTNSRGVNLNRNFSTDNWVKSIKDTDGTHPGGGGELPLSEPEASALAKLTTSYRPRLLLSFHAVGSLAIGDPGGYSAGYAARYASMVGYRDGTNSGNTNFDYNISGAYEDWTYSKAAIPSIVIELSSYTSVNYAGHYKALWAMLD